MKKLVVSIIVLMVMIMLAMPAMANDDPIWNDVYDWWKETNEEEYEMFINTEYNYDGFGKDGVAYYASNNSSLYYDELHMRSEINEYLDKCCKDAGIQDYEYHFDVIGEDYKGKHVLRITINAKEDLTKIEKANVNVDGPIYGLTLICYDRICVPTY